MQNTSTDNSFDFLTGYVLQLFEEHGLSDLTEEQKQLYVPQLLSHVERRIGIVLLPKLSDEDRETFVSFTNKEASQEEWKTFWYEAIPTFEEDVKNVLTEFSDSVGKILTKIAA
jgi:hypothetical protein